MKNTMSFVLKLVGLVMALTGLLTFLCLCGGLALAWVLDTQPSAPTVLLAAALAAAARLLTTRNAPSAR